MWRAMAWPIGRLWRVCVVGVALWWCVCGVVYRRVYGVVYGVCGYGVQALGVRMVSVCVCVGCTCVCRYIDVVSV